MRKHKLTLSQKLTMSYMLLVLGLLIVMAIFILPDQLTEMDRSLNSHISWTASLISQNNTLQSEMESGTLSAKTKQQLKKTTNSSSEIDYIVVVNTKDIRLFHPKSSEIGKHFVGGDERKILAKGKPYITTRQGSNDVQKRAFHQITAKNGEALGFVMVSASMKTVNMQQHKIIWRFSLIFIGMLIFGFFLSYFIAKNIRTSLLGYEPDALTKMYLQRDGILENLDEGIIALKENMDYLYANPSAKRIIGDKAQLSQNMSISRLIADCFSSHTSKLGLPYEINGNSVLLNILPVLDGKSVNSVLLIVRDRTETIELAGQLTGANHIVGALRATTHEHLNKLHVISGLLQIGSVDDAIAYIDGIQQETKDGYQNIIKQIQNKTIAALLLGKGSHAKELAIDFSLQKESFLTEKNPYLSTQELITILGNLIENAFEATKNQPDIRQVELFVGLSDDGLTIVVDDTGHGLTQEQIQLIYQRQFTTKGSGHGIGLRLIQEIVQNHDGFFDIESEPGVGTSFTVSIQKKKGETPHV